MPTCYFGLQRAAGRKHYTMVGLGGLISVPTKAQSGRSKLYLQMLTTQVQPLPSTEVTATFSWLLYRLIGWVSIL